LSGPDVSADVDSDPAGAGLLGEEDDEWLLERATFVYDALYEWRTVDVRGTPRT